MQHQRFVALLIAAAGLLALLPTATLAEQRVALVIGNASYAHAPRLANPLNDAADMGEALARLGFQVTKLENADYAALRQGLLAFTRAASAAEVAVVFYAGHGIEVDQRNFLVPVDAKLVSDQDVEFETVPLELVTRSVARASGLRLVILDACRENPFAVSMQRAGATRAIGRGLARVEPAGETLVAYASKEGTVAADGDGRNSPYSAALLSHLEEPGLELMLMFRKVRDAVLASTGGRQEPFVYGSLSSEGIYLKADLGPPDPVTTAPVAPRPPAVPAGSDMEVKMWVLIEDSTNPADFETYLRQFGERGRFAPLARLRLQQIRRQLPSSPTPSAQVQPEPQPTPIMAMLAVCAAHLETNRLTTGPGGTAFECYQDVLRRDAGNMQAIDGLAAIAERYRKWAEDAVQGADWQRARGYLQKLQQVHPEHPAIVALEARLEAEQARVEAERARLAEKRQQQERQLLEEQRQLAEARQQAEQRRQEAQRQAEEQRRREETRQREQARQQAEQRRQEAQRQAEEQRRREETRQREQARQQAESQKRRFRDMLSMVHVQGGLFIMGCEARQIDTTQINERPIRRVRLSSFEIGKYEVTQELWETVMGKNPSRFKGYPRRPVETVSWHDVQAFLRRLNDLTGESYRLPTEAEWEYAARGGQRGRRYAFAGSNKLSSVAWHLANSRGKTHPIGQKEPNELGLYDMSGNVREWVQDWYQRSLSGSVIDPQGPSLGSHRVSRGGSWHFVAGFCRSASRVSDDPNTRSDRLGFRLLRTSP